MITLLSESTRQAVGFKATGSLTADDVVALGKHIEFAIQAAKKPIGLLADISEMDGATWSARWVEMRFLQQHTSRISRMAVVSDSKWEEIAEMVVIAAAVLQAETLYFHSSEIAEAWRWAKMTKFDERAPVRVMYPGTGLFQNYTPEYTEL